MHDRTRLFLLVILFLSGYSPLAFSSPFDRVIPSEALLYWGFESTSDQKDAFPNYQQAIANWPLLLDDILEWKILRGEYEAIIKKSGVEEGFSALSGKTSCFALYPLIEGIPVPGVGLYVTDVEDPQKADRMLTTLFEEISSLLPGLRSVKDEYYGYTINSFSTLLPLPGLERAYTFKGSTLLISNSKSLLLRAIDRWEEERGFLAEVETYQKAIANLPENRSFTFFANISEVGKTGDLLLKNLQALQKLDTSKELDQALPIIGGVIGALSAFDSYSSTRSLDSAGRLVATSHLQMNIQIENEALQTMWSRQPVPFQYEKYLPRKVGTVMAGNILGLKDLWMIIQTCLTKFPPVKECLIDLRAWEEDSGFSIENDLLGWMGDSWCFLRPVMDLESVIATNQAALFLEITDNEAAQKGIQKIVDLLIKTYQLPIVTETENYLGAQINSLTLPIPLIPVEPSWCIHEKTLILTTRPAMIREMLDINAGVRNGIGRNRQYTSLKDAFNIPANKVTFQDNESEFFAFREAMRKVGSISEFGQNLPEAFRNLPGFVLDRTAYLMSCWQTLKGTVKRTTMKNNQIVTEKVWLYGDLRAVPSIDDISRPKISLGARDFIAAWAELSAQQGKPDRALRFYNCLVDFFPKEGAYLSRLGDLYKTTGNLQEALAVYDRILEKTPETAYLIGRESLLDNSPPEEHLTRIREMAGKTMRIREDSAAFGIALAKRDAGASDTAVALFQHIAQSPNSASAFAAAALKESDLLIGKKVEGIIEIPFTPNAPSIDGVMEQSLWGRCESVSIQDASGQTVAHVRLLRDDSNLYVLMNGNALPGATLARILFCPTRDYTHVDEITVEKNPDNKALAFLNRQIIDPFKITLDTGKSLASQQFIPQNLPDILKVIEKAIGKGEVNDLDLKIFETPQESFPAVWKVDENGECLETAIPWKSLQTEQKSDKPEWLFNVIRMVETDGESAVQSVSGGENPSEPFNYRFIRIH